VVFLRRFTLAFGGLLACTCALPAAGAPQAAGRQQIGSAALAYLGGRIARYQRATWRWERLMGVAHTESEGRALAQMSLRDIQRAVRLWQRRALAARRRAGRPPHLAAWLCIHRYEASWSDAGGPYYGGLQMDLGFQRTYGARLLQAKGTADHWTPLEQIWTAEKALRSRGFFPWTNTARVCGLV
jgi:hypothetical protein